MQMTADIYFSMSLEGQRHITYITTVLVKEARYYFGYYFIDVIRITLRR